MSNILNIVRILRVFYAQAFTVRFKVFEHSDHSKGCGLLKLAKPDSEPGESSCEKKLELGIEDYPEVSILRESATNEHAVKIMCGMSHQNIVSMKAVGPKSKDDCLLFIEKCDGELGPVIPCMIDGMHQIPDPSFQRIMM